MNELQKYIKTMSKMGIGAMNQLADALERAGFTGSDITKLTQSKKLADVKAIVNGFAEVKLIEHLVNCDVFPGYFSDNWKIKEHRKMGMIKFIPEKISLYFPEEQNEKIFSVKILIKKLRKRDLVNSNMFDYLLLHPELIPEHWKENCVLFLGTIYIDSFNKCVVRYLIWTGSFWKAGVYSVYEQFKPDMRIAIFD